jgi:CRISPR/Cas system-associated exonuclease Cas4 (RecB family)
MISLSWSRLSDYNQCPRKFLLKYIEKSFPPEGEKSIHLIKGEELHKQLEDYVLAKNGHGEMPIGFSPPVKDALPLVDSFFASGYTVYPEAQVSAGRDWKPLEWFDKKTMYRSIWDMIAMKPGTVFIGDYKSGKVYDYNTNGQLHLSAAIAMERFVDATEIHTAYIYLEHKKTHKIKLIRDEEFRTSPTDALHKDVKHHFENEFEKVQVEKEWKPTPNEFCKWCPANKTQCQFSRKL